VAPSRTLSYSPVFQVSLTMVADAVVGIDDGPLGFELLDARVPASKYDLSVTAVERTTDSEAVRATLMNYFVPAAEQLRNDTGLPISSAGPRTTTGTDPS